MGRRRRYLSGGHDVSWKEEARCRGVAPSLFYPEGVGLREQTEMAKAVCWGMDGLGECPVRQQCLEYSLLVPDGAFGIWGGYDENERRRFRRQAI